MSINYDLRKLLKPSHEAQWVALSPDRKVLIGAAPRLADLRHEIGEQNSNVVYMKVLPSDMEFAFGLLAWSGKSTDIR